MYSMLLHRVRDPRRCLFVATSSVDPHGTRVEIERDGILFEQLHRGTIYIVLGRAYKLSRWLVVQEYERRRNVWVILVALAP